MVKITEYIVIAALMAVISCEADYSDIRRNDRTHDGHNKNGYQAKSSVQNFNNTSGNTSQVKRQNKDSSDTASRTKRQTNDYDFRLPDILPDGDYNYDYGPSVMPNPTNENPIQTPYPDPVVLGGSIIGVKSLLKLKKKKALKLLKFPVGLAMLGGLMTLVTGAILPRITGVGDLDLGVPPQRMVGRKKREIQDVHIEIIRRALNINKDQMKW